jgi:tartrate dehydrogenase/decarboxylase/D-malate dehydrogenase
MKSYSIAVIPGDGIGAEVIHEGIKVLNQLQKQEEISFNFDYYDWGSDYYRQNGLMMPEDGLQTLQNFDAIYFGAVGDPEIPDHITLNGLLIPMRKGLDQYVCLRPNILFPGVVSPLSNPNVDLIVVRENTEGEYASIGGNFKPDTDDEIAIQTAIFTRKGTERIIRYAFEVALSRSDTPKLTSVTKSNAQRYGMVFWDKVFQETSLDYPNVQTESLLVDAACMDLIRRPSDFDVIVGSNLFGDILSDIAAVITGSMGLAPSANINPEKKFPSLFEPVHGSAPDIVGKNISNPIAAVLSAGMMLRHLGEHTLEQKIIKSVHQLIDEKKILTPDLGGISSTTQLGDELVSILSRI